MNKSKHRISSNIKWYFKRNMSSKVISLALGGGKMDIINTYFPLLSYLWARRLESNDRIFFLQKIIATRIN